MLALSVAILIESDSEVHTCYPFDGLLVYIQNSTAFRHHGRWCLSFLSQRRSYIYMVCTAANIDGDQFPRLSVECSG